MDTIKQNVWIEISKNAITNNLQNLRVQKPIVNVQSNALGFGINVFTRGLLAANVYGFAVGNLQEALELRKWGTNKLIIILNYFEQNEEKLIQDNFIIAPINSFYDLEKITTSKPRSPLAVALISNLFTEWKDDNIEKAIQFCQKNSDKVDLWGTVTTSRNSKIGGSYHEIKGDHHGLIIGRDIYGFDQSSDTKPVFTLKTRIIAFDQDQMLAVVPIGYGLGFSSNFSGFSVIVNGKRNAKVQKVSIDTTFILLHELVPVGTIVTIIGNSQNESITLSEAASYINLTPLELSTQLSPLIKRILVDN
ncbi:alanine racemase C-terminal domain-containing protein [Xylocopilactobacillus apis]|uniref:Alanine racemase n=1 Tax=Xylocopilactobacillus apis TaxID=2932183 RepID=A0AAU9CWC6_9LACO|nr:alanine racemase C-terminal domain-containing protein [Xylocopilactobacillus apis]BDR55659.1 alanine racemase [Xylocopilactobacillus apis]